MNFKEYHDIVYFHYRILLEIEEGGMLILLDTWP